MGMMEMIDRLKIGLTFLLHSNSPLWTQSDAVSFGKRLMIYAENPSMHGESRKTELRLNSLYRQSYIAQNDEMMDKVWSQWTQFAQKSAIGEAINVADLHELVLRNERILEDDCADFVEHRHVTNTTATPTLTVASLQMVSYTLRQNLS